MTRQPRNIRIVANGALVLVFFAGTAAANVQVAIKDVCLAGNATWSLGGAPLAADWGRFCQTVELRRFGGTSCVENDNGTPNNPFDDFWQGGGAYQIFWKLSRFEGKASVQDAQPISQFDTGSTAGTQSFPYSATASSQGSCNTRLALERTGAEVEAKAHHGLATMKDHDFDASIRFRPGAAAPVVPVSISAGEHLCSSGAVDWNTSLTFVEFTFAGTQTALCADGTALDLPTSGSGSGNVLYPF